MMLPTAQQIFQVVCQRVPLSPHATTLREIGSIMTFQRSVSHICAHVCVWIAPPSNK